MNTGDGAGLPGASLRLANILVPTLLSIAAVAVIAYFTFDARDFVALIPRVSGWFILAAVGTVVIRVLFGGWRLRYFSRRQISWRRSMKYQVAWDFFSYVTPSAIGGGPVLSVFISRDGSLPLGSATSVVLFSMLVDQVFLALTIPVLVALSFYVAVFPPVLGAVGTGTLMLVFLGYLSWVSLFAYGTLFRPRLLSTVVMSIVRLKWFRRFRVRALRVLSDLEQRSAVLRTQPPRFYLKGFVLSMVPWLSRYLLAVFVIWSVFPAADGLLIFLRSAAIQLGSLVLPTPGGAGGVEGLYLLFFGPDLIPSSLVAPTLLAWRFLSYFVFIIAGIFITMRHLQRVVAAREVNGGGRA